MNYSIETYILLFFIYSVLGWLIEVVRLYINPKVHRLLNRGFLIGPYLPIYGTGVIFITFLLSKYANDIPALFFLSIITCGILEYLTSYVMEKLFNARWWDYSQRKFNINGRICLETLIPFGIAGVIVVCITNPIFINLINILPDLAIHFICGGLIAVFTLDCIVSFSVMTNLKHTADEVDLSEDDDTENISNYVKDKAEDLAMQFESDVRKDIRKRRIKRHRRMLHIKLRTNKRIRTAKLHSQKMRTEITVELTNRFANVKASSEDFTARIKTKFAEKSILNKRLINAFPDVQILNIKTKIKEKINNTKK